MFSFFVIIHKNALKIHKNALKNHKNACEKAEKS